MALSLKDFVAEHPVDRERVDAHKERMLAETRAYRLRELREDAGLTQAQLAARIGVGQRQSPRSSMATLIMRRSVRSAITLRRLAAVCRSSMFWAIIASKWPDRLPCDAMAMRA